MKMFKKNYHDYYYHYYYDDNLHLLDIVQSYLLVSMLIVFIDYCTYDTESMF